MMSKSISFLFLLGVLVNVFSQSYDVKYSVEYALKDIHGNVINKIKLFRNRDKLKFTKTDNAGTDKETTTDLYIFKDEGMVYTVISSREGKFGSRHAMDMTYVGMQTGVYIFDLGNDGSIFNSSSNAGSGTVLGHDCVRYNLMTAPNGGTDYYMYQDNLMLKRVAATTTDGSTIEAVSFDNNADVPVDVFTLPADVTYY